MNTNVLEVNHTYRLVSIDQNNPCRGDCEPCSILNLLNRGFLVDSVFTVKQILGGNVLVQFEGGDQFAINLKHLNTCTYTDITNI